MKRFIVTSLALACVCLCTDLSKAQRSLRETTNQDRTDALRAAIQGGRAKHVILFLGDGMGDSELPSRAITASDPMAVLPWTPCRLPVLTPRKPYRKQTLMSRTS